MDQVKHAKAYWEARYTSGQTGWNIGYASTPIQKYIDGLAFKDIKILIPGAGNAYEAEYLHKQGFTEVHVIDIASQPIDALKTRVTSFPSTHIHNEDFFDHQGDYDLIIEQTFFCALDPVQREAYVDKMHDLLTEKGRLAGLLFNIEFDREGPPYGGQEANYRELFSDKFIIDNMAVTKASIPSRLGNELFFVLRPKAIKKIS